MALCMHADEPTPTTGDITGVERTDKTHNNEQQGTTRTRDRSKSRD